MKRNRTTRLLALLMAVALTQTQLYAEQQDTQSLTECSDLKLCLQTPTLTPEAENAMEQILQETVDKAVQEALQIQQEALREQSESQMRTLKKSRAFWLKAALVEAVLLGAGTYFIIQTH